MADDIMSSFTRYPILFEDECLIVVHKPVEILSHPNPTRPTAGRAAFEGSYSFKERRFDTPKGHLWLMHRLDQDTSGTLLAAKSPDVAENLRNQFEKGQIQKTYLALVVGKPLPNAGTWRDHLEKRREQGMVRSAIRPGLPPNAELAYQVRKTTLIQTSAPPSSLVKPPARSAFSHKFPSKPHHKERDFKRPLKGLPLTFLEIDLKTGKTHQIRAQAAGRGYPVAGDRIYGNFPLNRELKDKTGLKRLFLHSSRLGLIHPTKGGIIQVDAPMPEELMVCLKQLSLL